MIEEVEDCSGGAGGWDCGKLNVAAGGGCGWVDTGLLPLLPPVGAVLPLACADTRVLALDLPWQIFTEM